MKKGLKSFLTLIGAGIVLALTACTSLVPLSDNGNFPGDSQNYTILGRVEVEASATKSGYSKLYAAAKKQYPECDDVVNVKIDAKETTFLFIFHSYKYNMSGIAVDYK